MDENPALKVIIIIQARMGSSRLPGKSLMPILNKPVLGILLERLKGLKHAATIVVATTTEHQDEAIVEFCKQEKILYYRGSEEDVLDRYLKTARRFEGDVIVRLTADCPLIDPDVIDQVISYFLDHYPDYDYVSNGIIKSFPRGLDVEVFKKRSLEKAHEEAFLSAEREHVTPYIYRHEELFQISNFYHSEDLSHLRLTLDTPEDFELIELIFKHFEKRGFRFALSDIVMCLNSHPEWIKINHHIQQKSL